MMLCNQGTAADESLGSFVFLKDAHQHIDGYKTRHLGTITRPKNTNFLIYTPKKACISASSLIIIHVHTGGLTTYNSHRIRIINNTNKNVIALF